MPFLEKVRDAKPEDQFDIIISPRHPVTQIHPSPIYTHDLTLLRNREPAHVIAFPVNGETDFVADADYPFLALAPST